MKKALIFGITGQDGSYLADYLLGLGYDVHGFVRRSSRGYGALENIRHLFENETIYRKTLHLYSGDLQDGTSINRVIGEVMPDEIYALASQADVAESFFMPEYTLDVNGNGIVRILEAMLRFVPKAKLYFAATSELFGDVAETPQNENTRFNPQSSYSIGKYVGYQMVKKYREVHKLFVCSGLAFNHASPRRTSDYLDRKVSLAVARIKLGKQKNVRLGNLTSKRDWSYAKEMVVAFHKMLQLEDAEDFVLGSGENITVQEWVETCFEHAGLNWKDHVIIDPKLFRPAEVDTLLADSRKALEKLGWNPVVKNRDLAKLMVDADITRESNYV